MKKHPTRELIGLLIGTILTVLASLTILVHLAQILHLSFHITAYLGVAISISIFIGSIFLIKRTVDKIGLPDRKTMLALAGIALLALVLSLISYRNDTDDYYYAPNTVYRLEHPHQPMNFQVHFFEGGEGCEVQSLHWATSLPYEYAQGMFSYVFHIDFLTMFYLITPSLVSILIPLALFFLYDHFAENPLAVATAVFLTILTLLLMGGTHRSYGNFLFFRAQQGKTVLFTIGIPFFAGASLSYFTSPSRRAWWLLFATATAMVGATTTTLPLLISLSLVLLLSDIVSRTYAEDLLVTRISYLASLSYTVIYAGFLFFRQNAGFLNSSSILNHKWPSTLSGTLNLILDSNHYVTPILIVLSSLLALLLTEKETRRFLGTWLLAVLLIFFNPLTVPIFTSTLLPPTVYWRVYFLYPFPLVLGITIIKLSERLQNTSRWYKSLVFGLTFGLLCVSHLSPHINSIYHHRTTMRLPLDYKVPAQELDLAREIQRITPGGTTLAPQPLSGILPLLSAEYPQLAVRSEGVQLWLGSCGVPHRAEIRLRAAQFAAGSDMQYYPEFITLLGTEGDLIQNMVLHEDVFFMIPEIEPILIKYGFQNQAKIPPYRAVWKPSP